MPRPRRKRPDTGSPAQHRAPEATERAILAALAGVEDTDALLAWALKILPARNDLPESARAIVDAAFFDKADELGADRDLLAALHERRGGKPNGHANGHG